jgi:hypothetical protein
MAPHLTQSQRSQLHNMIRSASLSDKDIANVVNCSTRTVRSAHANHRIFKSVSAPKNVRGRRSGIPSHALTVLLDHLLIKPDLYLDDMVDFVWDQYELVISVASVRRSLKACNWSKKKNQRVARERDPELRDVCLYELSEYKSFQLDFVDESGCVTSGRAVTGPFAIHEPSGSTISRTVPRVAQCSILALAGKCQIHRMLETISRVRHSYFRSPRRLHTASCASPRQRSCGFAAATIVMLHPSCARLCQPQLPVEGIANMACLSGTFPTHY